MPTKKAPQPQASKLMDVIQDRRFLFKWLFILGGLTAGVTNAIAFQPDYLIWTLMVVGVVVGRLYFD